MKSSELIATVGGRQWHVVNAEPRLGAVPFLAPRSLISRTIEASPRFDQTLGSFNNAGSAILRKSSKNFYIPRDAIAPVS